MFNDNPFLTLAVLQNAQAQQRSADAQERMFLLEQRRLRRLDPEYDRQVRRENREYNRRVDAWNRNLFWVVIGIPSALFCGYTLMATLAKLGIIS